MKSKTQIAKTAKLLAAMRNKLKAMRDKENKMAEEIKTAMDKLGLASIETDELLVVVEPATRTSLDREKLVEVIGEKNMRKFERVTTYSTLRIKDIA